MRGEGGAVGEGGAGVTAPLKNREGEGAAPCNHLREGRGVSD